MIFNSNCKVNGYIDNIMNEANVISGVPKETFLRWYNELIEFLYSEIVQHERLKEFETSKEVPCFPFNGRDDERDIKYENIRSVFAGTTQLSRSRPSQIGRIENIYYLDSNNILDFCVGYGNTEESYILKLFYNYIPKEVTEDSDATIPLPSPFVEMVASKLRGELYKIVNDDELSAKWLNDFNNQLENFKIYVSERRKKFEC